MNIIVRSRHFYQNQKYILFNFENSKSQLPYENQSDLCSGKTFWSTCYFQEGLCIDAIFFVLYYILRCKWYSNYSMWDACDIITNKRNSTKTFGMENVHVIRSSLGAMIQGLMISVMMISWFLYQYWKER